MILDFDATRTDAGIDAVLTFGLAMRRRCTSNRLNTGRPPLTSF
jgi:hypothetical protein